MNLKTVSIGKEINKMNKTYIGQLNVVTRKLHDIVGEAPRLPFNSIDYIGWVNTQIAQGVLIDVDLVENEPFYMSKVYLTTQPTNNDFDEKTSYEELISLQRAMYNKHSS